MAYPKIGRIDYSYTGFQQAQGDNSFPGTQLDNDLNKIAVSVDSVDQFLRTAFRSDGKLQNGTVDKDALQPELAQDLDAVPVLAGQAAGSAQAAASAAGSAAGSASSAATNAGTAMTARNAAVAAREGAERAENIAAGFASDIVSQGNVPIYASVQTVQAEAIPAGISALRLNGRDAAGDGGAFLAVEVPQEPAHPFYVRPANGRYFEGALASEVSLRALGARGNGSDFEDVGRLNAMLAGARAVGIKTVDGLDRSYRINGSQPIIVPRGMTLRNAFFDCRDAAVGHKLFTLPGTRGAQVNLTADATYASYTLTLASTAGLAVGDIIFIGSSDLWSSQTQAVTRGEMAEIYAVTSGTSITISKPLDDNYRVSHSAYVRKLNGEFDNVSIRDVGGIGMGGGGQQYVIDAQYVRGTRLENFDFDAFDDRGINFLTAYNTRIRNPSIKRCRRTSLAYSIAINSGSFDTEIQGGRFFDARHGITFGGSTGVCRDGRVLSCVSEFVAGGYDCHPGTADITFEMCVAIGDRGGGGLTNTADQFSLNGYNPRAINCRARHGVRSGFALAPQAEFVPRGFNTGSLIGCEAEGGAATPFVVDTTSTPNTALRGVQIEGCKVLGAAGGAAIQVRATNAGLQGGAIRGVSIVNFSAPDCSVRGVWLQARAGSLPNEQGSISQVLVVGSFLDLNATATGANFVPVVNANATDVVVATNLLPSARGSYSGTGDERVIFAANGAWADTPVNNPETAARNRVVLANPMDKTVPITLTVAAGVVTVPLGVDNFLIDTEASAATSDLTDILGGVRGRRISLRTVSAARDVIVKTSSSTAGGSKIFVGSADFPLDSSFDRLSLEHDGSRWVRVSSADNAS